ncbi:MAG: hypothetical protein CBCREVIR_1660 [Candidatus Burkholderia crenata]|nr:MAG: hypothetical protein CBCREVIR_1660 [Candidatus Burkholderia crenata]
MFALYLQDSAAFSYGFADSLLGLRGESVRRVLFAVTPTKRDGVHTFRRPALSLFLAVRRLSFSLVAGNFNVQMKAQRNLW